MDHQKFRSAFEAAGDLFRVTKALTGLMRTGYRIPAAFREQICLSVTYTNDCGP